MEKTQATDERKTVDVRIRMTPTLKARMSKEAKEMDMSLSQYVRWLHREVRDK